jgi:hypothetical protein
MAPHAARSSSSSSSSGSGSGSGSSGSGSGSGSGSSGSSSGSGSGSGYGSSGSSSSSSSGSKDVPTAVDSSYPPQQSDERMEAKEMMREAVLLAREVIGEEDQLTQLFETALAQMEGCAPP